MSMSLQPAWDETRLGGWWDRERFPPGPTCQFDFDEKMVSRVPSLRFVKETTCFGTLRVVDSSCSWLPVNDQIETKDVKLPTRGPVWDDPDCESLSQ